MERGIQYLRELAVREMVYYDPDNAQLPTDPDEVQCTQPMWWKFVWSTPSSYTNSLAVMEWKGEEAPIGTEVAGQLQQYEESLSSSIVLSVESLPWEFQQFRDDISFYLPIWTSMSAIRNKRSSAQERGCKGEGKEDGKVKRHPQWMKWLADWQYEESLSSSLVSAVEKLSQEVWQLKEDMSYSPPVRTHISAIRSKRSSAPERGYRAYTPRGILWFYLCNHREEMRKWDGKPTSTLRARVHELQGKTAVKRDSSRKNAAPFSSGQPPRPSERPDCTYDPPEGTSKSFFQEGSSKYDEQDERGPASSQVEERDNRVYWTVWIRWPGTSDPQEYKALVDTGAQCTLMPSSSEGVEPISISGVMGGSQQLTLLEAEVSLTGNDWEKHLLKKIYQT
ncbi:hypothetical protein GRJ2_003225500 [Grus japonensis]|uniref:Peptidase A2 domain-containing protein n=1 Tax=Grus japonensis TaxID=30415 RepID=A0ABC9YC37_GRUJA